MTPPIESIGESGDSFTKQVSEQNILHFQAAFAAEEKLQTSPELTEIRREMEKQQAGLQSSAKRITMTMAMPGNPAKKELLLQQHCGRLTEDGKIPEKMDPKDYIRYGDINIMRWKTIYTEERLEKLQKIADETDRPESEDSIIDAIADNTDGKGYGLQMPEIDGDSETITEDLQQNRYIIFDKNVGLLRPNITQINQDLADLKSLPLNKDAEPFITYLEDLQKVDTEFYYKEVIVPKIRKAVENPRVADAKGAMRMIFFLALVAMGAISLIMERDKDFPAVAVLYLGAAAFVWNPKMLSNSPTKRLASEVSFTVPTSGDDKWAELMEGPFSSSFTGETGVRTFDMLMEPHMQTYNQQVAEKKITPEKYFTQLEEEGFNEQQITAMKNLQTEKPDVFAYLLRNLPRVRSAEAKDLLLSYVQKGMTANKLNHTIAESEPVVPQIESKQPPKPKLGGFGDTTWQAKN